MMHPPIRIYLASRYSRNAEMRGVRDVIQAIGNFEITSRWIDLHPDVVGDFSESFTVDALNTETEKCAPLGRHDLDDIDRADWLISFTGQGGKGGRHVEFGYGLAWKKRMFIVGPREHVFHTLPQVEAFATWHHFVVALSGGDL